MVLNMDINKEMYIWVDTVFRKTKKGGIVFDGNSFDDEMGFGLEKRCYEGEFIQLSKCGSVKNFHLCGCNMVRSSNKATEI